MAKIIEARWEKVKALSLKCGAHSPDSEFCVMEAAAFVAGEPWTDNPVSVPETISAFLRSWNDRLPNDEAREILKPFIPRVIGLDSSVEVETKRAVLCGDWLLRTVIPELLRLAGKQEEAEKLATLPGFGKLEDLEKAALDTRAAFAARATHRAALDDLLNALDSFAALDSLAALDSFAALDSLAALDDLLNELAFAARDSLIRAGLAVAALAALDTRAARAALNKKLESSQLDLLERMVGVQ